MAHFAKINNGVVEHVIVINNEECLGDLPESELLGQQFIQSIGLNGIWKQCSYNNNFRNTYPGVGYYYLEDLDIFVPPKPFESWSLDFNNNWQAPIPEPETGGPWNWNEENLQWETPSEE